MNEIRRRFLTLWLVLALLVPTGALGATSCGGAGSNCCKLCSTGKACGDTCIAKNLTCHKGAGCACNSRSPLMPEEARQP